MIIIVEGVDGAGKSTLVEELSARTGIPVYAPDTAGHAPETISAELSQAEDRGAWGAILSSGESLILDRAFPSEYAYGNAYARRFDSDAVMRLDTAVSKRPHVAFLLGLPHPLREAHDLLTFFADTRGVADVDAGLLADLDRHYREFLSFSRMDWVTLDACAEPRMNLMVAMRELAGRRASKDDTMMDLARVVARRSTCLSRRVGAVLLSQEGHVISTGYNGAPSGIGHQGECPRLLLGTSSGEGLELCNDVHAEENCVVQAALNGATTKGGTVYTTHSPCHRCARMLINGGIKEVVAGAEYGDRSAFELFEEAGVKMRMYGD